LRHKISWKPRAMRAWAGRVNEETSSTGSTGSLFVFRQSDANQTSFSGIILLICLLLMKLLIKVLFCFRMSAISARLYKLQYEYCLCRKSEWSDSCCCCLYPTHTVIRNWEVGRGVVFKRKTPKGPVGGQILSVTGLTAHLQVTLPPPPALTPPPKF